MASLYTFVYLVRYLLCSEFPTCSSVSIPLWSAPPRQHLCCEPLFQTQCIHPSSNTAGTMHPLCTGICGTPAHTRWPGVWANCPPRRSGLVTSASWGQAEDRSSHPLWPILQMLPLLPRDWWGNRMGGVLKSASLCWSPWSVFSRPRAYLTVLSPLSLGWENGLYFSAGNACDEFSCKSSQNPYFLVTHHLSPKIEGLVSVGFLCFTVRELNQALCFWQSFQQQLGGWFRPTLNIQ